MYPYTNSMFYHGPFYQAFNTMLIGVKKEYMTTNPVSIREAKHREHTEFIHCLSQLDVFEECQRVMWLQSWFYLSRRDCTYPVCRFFPPYTEENATEVETYLESGTIYHWLLKDTSRSRYNVRGIFSVFLLIVFINDFFWVTKPFWFRNFGYLTDFIQFLIDFVPAIPSLFTSFIGDWLFYFKYIVV
jgi:hypothetical protein